MFASGDGGSVPSPGDTGNDWRDLEYFIHPAVDGRWVLSHGPFRRARMIRNDAPRYQQRPRPASTGIIVRA